MAPTEIDTGRGLGAARTLAACLAASILGFAAILLTGLSPRDNGAVAALFPPWWNQARALTQAVSAGRITAAGGLPTLFVVRGDPATLPERLRHAGALILLDPRAALGCSSTQRPRP